MPSEVILVAVDASKEVTDYTLEWAVQNVIKPKDSLILLAILPSTSSPHDLVFFKTIGVLKKKCNRRENTRNLKEKIAEENCRDQLVQDTHDSCTQIIRQLLKLHSIVQVRTEVRVVADQAAEGSITKLALEIGATWVILDRISIHTHPPQVAPRISIDTKLSRPKQPMSGEQNLRTETNQTTEVAKIDRLSSIRKAMSVSVKQPPIPPPLCSVCKNNAPIFGRAPRKFTYMEIQEATNGFSKNNFLAKGGFGDVYKGVLDDGQVVAVKQHKVLSAQGASEFCSEVEVLSCAQHKNLVILVGYCTEMEWLLVYEFVCHGSLDKHLYGRGEPMAWQNRMKVAVGSAGGLRYLHEDCRVGCIVHRDFRPNNILLTHDFESMVGDFGLARWQADGQSAEETRIVGAFGYLAPEYTQTGLITEKADVYAFGVVLLELLTGIKATEFARNAKQPYMPDWSRQFLESKVPSEIVDPRLDHDFVEKEVECMIQAASLCISPDPDQRPRMSEVLKILEGYMPRVVPGPHSQPASTFPGRNLIEDHIDNKSEILKLQRNRLVYAGISDDKCNPLHQVLKDTQLQSMYKQVSFSDENKIAGTANKMDKNKSKLPRNEDYQEYLQGSLSRYIQNMKVM
ncbi:hypothetical protein DCAR_0206229 [Daucus carota subsp. sativus]|uniref:Protein kinase domain-containing protein n=1 Tax=Daucus carota subsp. sativus TaxID=79200 RepID=A0AAF0WDA6_DAUCS|nr:hypothetical protein DCAR_0206229 [Daucus carota subsp. sativus]